MKIMEGNVLQMSTCAMYICYLLKNKDFITLMLKQPLLLLMMMKEGNIPDCIIHLQGRYSSSIGIFHHMHLNSVSHNLKMYREQ